MMLKKYPYLRNANEYFRDIAEVFNHYESVLDICCGDGGLIPHLTPNQIYDGFDLSEDCVSYCNKKYPERAVQIADVKDLEFLRKITRPQYDVLVLSGAVFFLKPTLLKQYLEAYSPKLVIFAHTRAGLERIEKLTEGSGLHFLHKIDKRYDITKEPCNGTPAEELNNRVIRAYRNFGVETKDFYNFRWKYWAKEKPDYFETGLYQKRAEFLQQWIREIKPESIFEFAGGGTVMAKLTCQNNPDLEYHWSDFSDDCVKEAEKNLSNISNARVSQIDITNNRGIFWHNADLVICFSWEHFVDDLKFMEEVPKGMRMILSCPNVRTEDHFRWFDTEEEVRSRYGHLVKINRVEKLQFGKVILFQVDCERC
jgi:SAM-dependent methyltransferase